MGYTNQWIIQLASNDYTLYKMCTDLHHKFKGPSSHYEITVGQTDASYKNGLSAAANPLTTDSRLYVVGHGNLTCFTVSGYTGQTLAKVIADVLTLFNVPTVKRVAAVGCFSTMWNKAAAANMNTPRNKHNFAQQLHAHLGNTHKIYTQVSAYGSCVATDSATGRKKTGFYVQHPTMPTVQVIQWNQANQAGKYDNTANKLYYYWKGPGVQAYSNKPRPEDADMMDVM